MIMIILWEKIEMDNNNVGCQCLAFKTEMLPTLCHVAMVGSGGGVMARF